MTFQALREFRQRMSEGSGTTARETPHAKRAGGTVADIYIIYIYICIYTYIYIYMYMSRPRGTPTSGCYIYI